MQGQGRNEGSGTSGKKERRIRDQHLQNVKRPSYRGHSVLVQTVVVG